MAQIVKEGKLYEFKYTCPHCDGVAIYTRKDIVITAVMCPTCETFLDWSSVSQERNKIKQEE